jgi:hypothetical protein
MKRIAGPLFGVLVLGLSACDWITGLDGPRTGERVLVLGGGSAPMGAFIVDAGLQRVVERDVAPSGHLHRTSPDGSLLYYVAGGELRVVDLATMEVVRRVTREDVAGPLGSPALSAPWTLSPDGSRLFFGKWTNPAGEDVGVGVVDARTFETVNVIEGLDVGRHGWNVMIPVPPSERYPDGAVVAAIAPTPAIAELTLAILDPEDGEVLDIHDLGALEFTMALSLTPHPAGTAVFVNRPGYAFRVELADGSVSRQVDTPGFASLALAPDSTRLYRLRGDQHTRWAIDVLDLDLNTLHSIDLSRHRIDGDRPRLQTLSFGADGRTLYVVAAGHAQHWPWWDPPQRGHLLVVDIEARRLRASIPLGVENPGPPVTLR